MMSPDRFVHYTLGIPEIDADHWKMLSDAKTIVDLIKNKNTTEAYLLFIILNDEVKVHCIKEENLMRAINYKWINTHIESHKKILFRLAELDVNEASPDYSINSFAHRLEELLVYHIDSDDMQYAEEVKNHPGCIANYIC